VEGIVRKGTVMKISPPVMLCGMMIGVLMVGVTLAAAQGEWSIAGLCLLLLTLFFYLIIRLSRRG
jgi:hypothetical protein